MKKKHIFTLYIAPVEYYKGSTICRNSLWQAIVPPSTSEPSPWDPTSSASPRRAAPSPRNSSSDAADLSPALRRQIEELKSNH